MRKFQVVVQGEGRFRVRCQSVWGRQLHMTGEKTSVHKPLLSAGDVTDKGHTLWLDGNVGCAIQKNSPILTAMRMCFENAREQHSWNVAIDLTKERGFFVRVFLFLSSVCLFLFLFPDSAISPPIFTSCASHTELGATDGITSLTTISCTWTTTTCTL